MRALRSLLTIVHQENESTEGIYDRLYSALLNLKLVGCNIYPEGLQSKEKVINPSRSDKDTAVTVEKKLMGNFLMELASNKKYGDLKRPLINSMTQGKNHYTNRMSDAYTMLCNYITGRIKNKNE